MFTRILYAHDFSKESEYAFEYVKKLVEAGTKEVDIVHVFDEKKIDLAWELKSEFEEEPVMVERKEILDALVKKAESQLQHMKDDLINLGIEVKVFLMTGVPALKILQTAKDLDVSLIVLGARGEGAFKELLMGSTAMRILRSSTKPVLVIKSQEEVESRYI